MKNLTNEMLNALPIEVMEIASKETNYNKQLSNELIDSVYYTELRKDLATLIRKYNDLKFCFNIPNCTTSYDLSGNRNTNMISDKVAIAAQKNIDNGVWLHSFYNTIIDLANKLTHEEATYLVGSFFDSHSEEKIEEKLGISHMTLFKIRKSALAKMYLQLKSQALM